MIAFALLLGFYALIHVLVIYFDSIDKSLERIAGAYEEDLRIYRKQVNPTDKRK